MHKNYYNSISDSDLQKGGYYHQKISYFKKEISAYAKKKDNISILDLACNEGGISEIFLKYGKVCAVDINQEAVERACQKGIEARYGDVLNLVDVFPGKLFDVVVAGDIVEHVFDTDLLLNNIRSVLKQGGMLLLSTPNLVSLGRRWLALTGKNPFCEYSCKKNGINVGHIRYYTLDNLNEQLAEKKFVNISIKSDTANIPLSVVDKTAVSLFPGLGRELLAKAYKL